jgi:hypothetical protein
MKLSMLVPRRFLHSDASDPSKPVNGGENETISSCIQCSIRCKYCGRREKSTARKTTAVHMGCIMLLLPYIMQLLPCRLMVHMAQGRTTSILLLDHRLALFPGHGCILGVKDSTRPRRDYYPQTKDTHNQKHFGIWTIPNDMAIINVTPLSTRLQLDQCPLANAVDAKDSSYVVQQLVLDAEGEIDTRALPVIIAFHAFSFAFQVFTAWGDQYYQELKRGRTNLSHFIEYSLTASLLLNAMATQFGTTDIFLLISIGANCTGCIMHAIWADGRVFVPRKLRNQGLHQRNPC